MKVLVCLSGVIYKEILDKEYKEAEYIIAADGGGNALYNNNIFPNIIIGDLDSISSDALNYFKGKNVVIEKHPVEKDYTDGELALNKALSLNPSEIVFIGALGSRIDHVFGNIGLLFKALQKDVKAKIIDKNNIMILSDKDIILEKIKGFKFSVLAYNGSISNLSVEGGKYELNNYDLKCGETITISNEFKNNDVKISFKKGVILIIISKDDDL